jgi:hypothetical protein
MRKIHFSKNILGILVALSAFQNSAHPQTGKPRNIRNTTKTAEERIITCSEKIRLKELKTCKSISVLRDLGNRQFLIRVSKKTASSCLSRISDKCQIQENFEYKSLRTPGR